MKHPFYLLKAALVVFFLPLCISPKEVAAQTLQPNFNMELLAHVDEYPNEKYSAIWGYVDNKGREYAVIGIRSGTAIYSLEDPKKPKRVAFIPGTFSLWREMKYWKDYVYMVTDGASDGLLIINMKNAPESITWNYLKLQAPIDPLNPGLIVKSHTVWIDENGVMYLSGSNVNRGAVVMYDLKPNPELPLYLGAVNSVYSHDNFTRGDTIWSADLYEGRVGVYDARDKKNPKLLKTINTTFRFTHNCALSDDGKYLFTTDERANSLIDAFSVADLNNVELLDAFTAPATRNQGVIPHNVHYYKGFLPTAYYTEGVKILDVSRPQNMVEVASYDTYQGPEGFDGVWGIDPYLPSGILIASDITSGLWVFKPTYQKACFLEGQITDARNKAPLSDVEVKILAAQVNSELSQSGGQYQTGIAQSGTYRVVYYKEGYRPDTLQVLLQNGKVTLLNVQLRPDDFTSGLKEAALLPIQLLVSPNPFFESAQITYKWQSAEQHAVLKVFNSLGVLVEKKAISAGNGTISIGTNLPKGHYWVQVQTAAGTSKGIAVVKH